MTSSDPSAQSARAAAGVRVRAMPGLPGAIDDAAAIAPPPYRFLRHRWFDAALATYGGRATTLVAEAGGSVVAALPIVPVGLPLARLGGVPGCYWPFRSFPVAEGAGDAVFAALLDGIAKAVRCLRFGPVYDDDPAFNGLRAAATARGWAVLPRFVADSYALDMAALAADGGWPRNSTLRKNRFHEKHLAAHGALDWRFVSGAEWSDSCFDALADVEGRSWLAERTDGSDAKFTRTGHGAFWRHAAQDPVLAEMLWAAVLHVDGVPMAFSFDLNAGARKYAIANSYDPAVGKHSPGKLLYYRNLQRALGDGMAEVDWGAGDSGYKRVIGAARGPAIRDWLFLRPGLPALAGRLIARRWAASGNPPPAPDDAEEVAAD